MTTFGRQIANAIENMGRVLATIGSLCAFIIFVSMVTDVIGREVFSKSTEYAVDISELLMVPLVFLVLPYVAQVGANVKVDILTDRMSPVIRHVVYIISLLLFLPFAGLIAWTGWLSTYDAFRFNSVTAAGIPLWPALLMIPIGAVLLCGQLLVQLTRAILGERQDSSH
jgi:TRAP-type C4-dicarboxylate transport system permease small subunit